MTARRPPSSLQACWGAALPAPPRLCLGGALPQVGSVCASGFYEFGPFSCEPHTNAHKSERQKILRSLAGVRPPPTHMLRNGLLLTLCASTTHALCVSRNQLIRSPQLPRCTRASLSVTDVVPTNYVDYMARRKRMEEEQQLMHAGPEALHSEMDPTRTVLHAPPPALPLVPPERPIQTPTPRSPTKSAVELAKEQMAVWVHKLPGRSNAMPESCVSPLEEGSEDSLVNKDAGKKLLQKIKDAGVAGIVSYGIVQIGFWGASIPACILGYYKVTGHWPDLSNPEDQAQLGAEAFAFLNLARLAIPLRVALALSMTQKVQTGLVDKFQGESLSDGATVKSKRHDSHKAFWAKTGPVGISLLSNKDSNGTT